MTTILFFLLLDVFIHGIWICVRCWKSVHIFVFLFIEWMFVAQTTTSGQFLLFVRWRHLQHIWMNIECIHVSKFLLILPRIQRCIVGAVCVFSFFVEQRSLRRIVEIWSWHWRDRFFPFQILFSFLCSSRTSLTVDDELNIFIDKFQCNSVQAKEKVEEEEETNANCIRTVVVFWFRSVFFLFDFCYCFVLFSHCATPLILNNGFVSEKYHWRLVQKYSWQHKNEERERVRKAALRTCFDAFRCVILCIRKSNVRLWPDWCSCLCMCITWLLDCHWNYHNVLHLFVVVVVVVKHKSNNHQIQWRKCAQMNTYSLFKALCVTALSLSVLLLFFSFLKCYCPVRVKMPITEVLYALT